MSEDRPLKRSSLETTTSERLATIVAAAERAATQVIDDAEAQARGYLEDARAEADELVAERVGALGAALDGLIADAEAIRQRSERLLEALGDARSQLEGEAEQRRDGTVRPAEPSPRGSHLSAVAPVEDPGGEAAEADRHPVRDSPAGARLLATQMAVSGNSREEIASRLRNGFEIEDTDAILDAILGPED